MGESAVRMLPDQFYHIYNHANGNDKIFINEGNYIFFLKRYREYISPVAETYAYCLMPNHFHLLIRLKSAEAIFEFLKKENKLPEKAMTLEEFELLFKGNDQINLFSLHVSRQFSNFFNSYTQSLNKAEARKGNLFMRAFKRREIASEDYLKRLILYIHCNPVHHGFVERLSQWKFVSYHSIVSEMETLLKREEVIRLFEDAANFKSAHQQVSNMLLANMEAEME